MDKIKEAIKYEVIADYPFNKHFTLGEVITVEDDSWYAAIHLENYPAIFKNLSLQSSSVIDKLITNEEKVNQLAIEMLSVLHKVVHAIENSNMKGTILHSEITAVVKKAMLSPIKIKR